MDNTNSLINPVPLGLKKSFGYGDRLGLAGPGHLAANSRGNFAPILAQQSIREMSRTDRTPTQVMQAAQSALQAAGYSSPWGADADHLKTPADVDYTLAAGFCFFTIDPSDFVNNAADTLPEKDLIIEIAAQITEGVLPGNWLEEYIQTTYEVSETLSLKFDRESLLRAAVKYGRAINHCETMARHIEKVNGDRGFEIEISVDETDSPTTVLEHLFFALELKRRRINVISLAPRFIGEFEKGVDYKGDHSAFESKLQEHVAIAKAYGPYKISVHSGSDKFSIYPIIGRVCEDLLHVKTAGTSYLEALRVICRQNAALFDEIIQYSLGRFTQDRVSYHISANESDFTTPPANNEQFYLDENQGRQLLHVTFGSVLTVGKTAGGRLFKDAIMESLTTHADLHTQFLESHLGKHIDLLSKG